MVSYGGGEATDTMGQWEFVGAPKLHTHLRTTGRICTCSLFCTLGEVAENRSAQANLLLFVLHVTLIWIAQVRLNQAQSEGRPGDLECLSPLEQPPPPPGFQARAN